MTWIIIALVSLVLSALFSGTEMAFVTADRVRMEIDVKRGGIISRIINRFYARADFFISSVLVGNNIMLVVYGMAAAALLEPWITAHITDNQAGVLLVQTLVSTAVILITGEFIPKSLFGVNPNVSLKLFALPVYFFYLLFYPLSLFAAWLSNVLMRLLGVKQKQSGLRLLSVGDLNDYLEETIDTMEEKRTTVESEVKIFQNALDFSTTRLRDCMTPRNELVAVNVDSVDRPRLVDLFMKTGRSKVILYRDDIDNIIGYLHVRDLFVPGDDWRTHIRPLLYAPENLLANKMMRRLLQQKRSMAVVVDEFGGTAGIVTFEDLVEEIFGDIQDEHDTSSPEHRCVAPGVYELAGRCEIAEINEIYHLDLPESDDYQTVAGYILHSTGTIPEEGATVMLGPWRFDILKRSDTRLELLRLSGVIPTDSNTAPENKE
ncbi:MAG: hemolysin family protein [Muribaculaceae bacterium]|nr:hemolysin family protein [Muribaculaceae bacterium]